MSHSEELRQQRAGTVINSTSKGQDADVIQAKNRALCSLNQKYGNKIKFFHLDSWLLRDVVAVLRKSFSRVDFHIHLDSSSMRPDGGILCLKPRIDDGFLYPILIAEVKNQGTNDKRHLEGKPKQAKGNAIERLGKNVIGLRAALLRESIFPFVCFGYGCDFAPDSSILDRVSTIAMFGKLNTIHLHNEADGKFNRGSFYFREEKWSIDEMHDVMTIIADRAILYYFSKYGEEYFSCDEE